MFLPYVMFHRAIDRQAKPIGPKFIKVGSWKPFWIPLRIFPCGATLLLGPLDK